VFVRHRTEHARRWRLDRVVIGRHTIGGSSPCFVIAEAGVNHNGSLKLAKELVKAAADAGADAVKFQTFRAEALAAAEAPVADYQRSAGTSDRQLKMLRELELAPAAFRELSDHAAACGILFLSTAFDDESADLLESLDVPAFKIPSGELTNHDFLRQMAARRRPLIVSTGMARLGEVESAVGVIRATGNDQIVLLHCVSEYPAAPATANLRAMQTMRAAFGVPVGFSDHTLGLEVSLAAATLGAAVIEKHLTLDNSLPGPDHAASLEPAPMKSLVDGIRAVQSALGSGVKEPTVGEMEVAAAARRSLVARRHLKAGEVITADALIALRPGTGLPPSAVPYIVGRRTKRAIAAGTLFSMDLLD
jgi:N,N'-diacetyllegionaminate synthase